MEFARLESSADATPAVMLSPAVAMAAELPLAVADTEPQLPGNSRAQHNCRGGTTEEESHLTRRILYSPTCIEFKYYADGIHYG